MTIHRMVLHLGLGVVRLMSQPDWVTVLQKDSPPTIILPLAWNAFVERMDYRAYLQNFKNAKIVECCCVVPISSVIGRSFNIETGPVGIVLSCKQGHVYIFGCVDNIPG